MVYYPIDINKAVKRECERRRYSNKTISTYLYCINRFLKWSRKELGKISKKDVREFLEALSEKGMAGKTMNVYHMAIKFLFEDVLHKKMWINIRYSKENKKLPVVLDKDEIKRLINSIKNNKHKLMVELMYGSGMRVSELTNLCIKDLEIDKGFGFVRKGKGNKDRLFLIPSRLKDKIKDLIKKEKLESEMFLFCSLREKNYDNRTLNEIIKKACKKAKINKKVSCHTLRHSFATHLIEQGSSVSEVQSLLGHKSPETTFTYLHLLKPNMIKVKSPLDIL